MTIIISDDLKSKIISKYPNQTTSKLFISRLKSICKKSNIDDVEEIKNNIDNIITEIKKLTESTQYIFLMTIKIYLSFYQIENDTLNEAIKTANTLRRTIDDNRHKTEELNDNFTVNDILKYCQEKYTKSKSITNLYRLTMFQILSNVPIRLKEFESMSFEDDNKCNFIDINNKQIIIRNHKNDKHKQDRIIKLNQDDIEQLILHKNVTNTNILFSGKFTKQPMANMGIEQLFRKTIEIFCEKNKIKLNKGDHGIHMLRKIRETDNLKPFIDAGIDYKKYQEINEKCQQLGHGIVTALKYYNPKKK